MTEETIPNSLLSQPPSRRDKIIKIVPYTGFGRNNDYTIELQLTLDDVKGLGDVDKEKAEKGSSASGAPADGGAAGAMPEMPPPAPEVAWVVKYGDILKESVVVAKTILTGIDFGILIQK